MSIDFTLSYYPWISQASTPTAIRAAVDVFGQNLQQSITKNLGKPVTVTVRMAADVPPQIEMVIAQNRHIALLNPLGYVFARKKNPAVNVVALAMRMDPQGKPQPTYLSQVYTAKRTGIRALAEIPDHSVGFGKPISTSGFLVPAALLKKEHRLFAASSLGFLGDHMVVAKAVYDGKVDVGAGHDGAIINLAKQYGYGDAEDRLIRITWTAPIPSDPVVVHTLDATELKAVTDAVLQVGTEPAVVKQTVAIFWDGSVSLGPTSAKAYDVLDSALGELAVDLADLLP